MDLVGLLCEGTRDLIQTNDAFWPEAALSNQIAQWSAIHQEADVHQVQFSEFIKTAYGQKASFV